MEQSVPKNKAIPTLYWFGAGIAAFIILGFFIFPNLKDNPSNQPIPIAHQKIAEIEDTAIAPVTTQTTESQHQETKQTVSTEPAKPQLNKELESQILEIQSAYRSEGFKLVSPYYLNNTKNSSSSLPMNNF